MDQNPAPRPAKPSPSAPADRAHWTPARQRRFLIALLDSGCVAQAARSVGMSPTSAHRLRRRLAGTMFDQSGAGRSSVMPNAWPIPSRPTSRPRRRRRSDTRSGPDHDLAMASSGRVGRAAGAGRCPGRRRPMARCCPDLYPTAA